MNWISRDGVLSFSSNFVVIVSACDQHYAMPKESEITNYIFSLYCIDKRVLKIKMIAQIYISTTKDL